MTPCVIKWFIVLNFNFVATSLVLASGGHSGDVLTKLGIRIRMQPQVVGSPTLVSRGSLIVTVVPSPGTLSTEIVPL